MAQADVTPDVTVEVDEDGIEAGNGVKQFGDVVVRLDLGGIGVPGQAQAGDDVITSYSIHYTKLYDMFCPFTAVLPTTPRSVP